MPVGVHRRAGVLGHDHVVALVGARSGRVLDRHVRPGPGDDDRVAPVLLEQALEGRVVPRAHPHLLDHVVAVLRLESVGRRRAPRAAHERARVLHAVEERRVELQAWSALLDDVVHVDDGNALRPGRLRKRLDVLDDVLLLRVLRRPGLGERAALDDDVVLQVLDDQRTAARVELQRFVSHLFLLSACRARGAARRCVFTCRRTSTPARTACASRGRPR